MIKNSDKKIIFIISFLAITLLIGVFIFLNLRVINSFGVIHRIGGGFIVKSSVIDCELSSDEFILINGFVVKDFINQSILIKGLSLGNLLFIQSFNDSFNPRINCFEKHVSDIILEPSLNLSIKSNKPFLFNYNISNNQDKRLFYECTLLTDCFVSRKFFTGYLDPGEVELVVFNISCSEGVHESVIKTVFVDELMGYHYINDSLIINSV